MKELALAGGLTRLIDCAVNHYDEGSVLIIMFIESDENTRNHQAAFVHLLIWHTFSCTGALLYWSSETPWAAE